MSASKILQIVPQLPGSYDGVGDYALRLARVLQRDQGIETVFAVAGGTLEKEKDGFAILSGLPGDAASLKGIEHVVLHYANYGYQRKGVPFQLRDFARRLRRRLQGRWLTMFHELYASGPPWRSEFWLRPWQVRIARDIVDVSDVCLVSNEVIAREIRAYDPAQEIKLVPVMSNFGEPALPDAAVRSTRRWAICGGAAILRRSLQSFGERFASIPASFVPDSLEVLGGWRNREVEQFVAAFPRQFPGLACQYRPEISADEASEVLARCAFGWLDYFGTGKVWPGMIFKSGSFAAFCAHGIVPVLAHDEPPLGIKSDLLPGPFCVAGNAVRFPAPEQLEQTQREIHSWYHRHASAAQTAAAYAGALA